MQIACPNCHTRYALDDRLVPAGGAPVQCTRCGLVFTAQHGVDAQGEVPQPASSGTLAFGSAARTAGPVRTEAYGKSPPPSASTQVFGAGAPSAAGAVPGGGAGHTQVFGSGGPEPARTRVFGAGAAAPRVPAAPSGAARTQVFGGTPAAGAPAAPPPPEPPPSMRTQVFGGASPGAAGATGRPAVFGGAAAEARNAEGLDLPPMPEDGFLPGGAPEPLPIPGVGGIRPSRPDPAERALARQLRQRQQRAIWVVLGLAALAALAYAGSGWWSRRSDVPAVVRADRDAASALLRKDDPQSRASALKVLDALVTRYPAWVGARASQALAQTLELDDQRALLRRDLGEAEQLKTQLARLEAERTPADWKVQADGARTRIEQLKKLTDPRIEAVNALETTLNGTRDALNRLPPANNEDDERARLRADAVFAGVAGRADRAISDGERYRQLGGKDGWGEVAYAEYVLSAKSPPPDSVEQAARQMNELVARDSTFIRPYVLAGRLLLALRQKDAALAKLDAAVALNPRHVLAQALVDQERGK